MYGIIIALISLFLINSFIQQSIAIASKIDTKGSNLDNLSFESKDVWVALIAGGIGFATTHVTTIVKAKKELKGQYDIDLRNKRIEAYRGIVG
ncbi:MAG TPA: hypothetical protein VFI73_08540 [Candidatus Nitrosopolaris sp.]|nr:hypothetical protein [Candidatus Nitrosopolaris sp.]